MIIEAAARFAQWLTNNWPELAGIIGTILAVAGVWLNNHRFHTCFWLFIGSNMLALAVHAQVGVWSMAVRDAIFLALAVHGLYAWSRR